MRSRAPPRGTAQRSGAGRARSAAAAPGRSLGAVYLEHDRVALAPTRANGGAAEAAAAAAQLVYQRSDDAGAGGTDRVAERDRPAVHVHLVLLHVEHPHP